MATLSRSTSRQGRTHFNVRHWHILNVSILLLLLYVVLPQFTYFRNSFQAARHARTPLLLVAMTLTAFTYLMAAGLYQFLAKRKLWFSRTILMRVASGFINRLLPGGIGGISLSVQYLRASGHTLAEASTVVGTNNSIGFIGHVLLIGALIATTDAGLRQIHTPHLNVRVYEGAGVLLFVALAILIFSARIRRLLASTVSDVVRNLWSYKKRPKRLIGALLLSTMLTVTYATILFICGRAVGGDITFSTAFIVFTVGMLAGTVTPTPGGLVGMEAGLVAGFVGAGVSSSEALAAALLFRLLTYWLPIIPGIIAFRVAERRHYI